MYNLLLRSFLLQISLQEILFPLVQRCGAVRASAIMNLGKRRGMCNGKGAACAFQDENECLQFRFFVMTGVSNLGTCLWVEITLV